MTRDILEELSNGEAVFTSGTDRIRIVRDFEPIHPWAYQNMICHLVSWDDDVCFGTDKDITDRPDDIKAIQTSEDLGNWMNVQTEPYYVLGLLGDKYGFLTTREGYPMHGALVITKTILLKYFPNTPDDHVMTKMMMLAKDEAKILIAWYGGGLFGFMHEQDIPTVDRKPFDNPVKAKDSAWGFYLLDTDYSTMLQAMCEHFDTDNEALMAIKEEILGA